MWHISFDPICTIAASKRPHDIICGHSSLCSLSKVRPPASTPNHLHQLFVYEQVLSVWEFTTIKSFQVGMQPVGERAPNHRNAVTFHTDHLAMTKAICTADWMRFAKLFVCDRGAWPLSTSVQRKWPGSVFKCLNQPPATSVVRLRTTSLVTHVSARVNFADWRVIHHISNQCS